MSIIQDGNATYHDLYLVIYISIYAVHLSLCIMMICLYLSSLLISALTARTILVPKPRALSLAHSYGLINVT